MHRTPSPHPCPPNSTQPPFYTCLSCPDSVPPPCHSCTPLALSLTDSSNFQSLASPSTLNPSTLLLYSPGSRPVDFSVFFKPAEGWRELDRGAVRALRWLWRGYFGEPVVGAVRCSVMGVEFGRGSCSVREHNGTMNPQKKCPPNCYYHKKRPAEPI